MITNVLLANSALIPAAMVLIVVVCAGVGYVLMRARRPAPRLWVLVGLSLLPVAALTLAPTAGRLFVFCVVQFSMPTWRSVELLANVGLFIPPVLFATLATRKPLLMLAAGATLSAVIEVIQGLIPAIGRSCDTNDWTMNTAGTAVAVLLATAITRHAHRRPTARSEH